MAWSSKGEEVRRVLEDYVYQLAPEGKKRLRGVYDQRASPYLGEWKTMSDITFISLRNKENVLHNLNLAIFKEMLGLGTQWYCVVRSFNKDFEALLMLTLHYLPKDKFCMYPEGETLLGPFLHAPWDNPGQQICARPTISDETYVAYLEMRAREAIQH